ncbi:MAG: MFS transporter [Sciscionella sp.]
MASRNHATHGGSGNGWRARLGLPPLRGRWPLLAATLIDSVGTGVFLPFSVLFFTVTTPLALPQVGLGLGAAGAASLPFGPLFGALTDRWGPHAVVVGSNLLRMLGFLAYLTAGSIPALIISAWVVRVGIRAFWASSGPLITQFAAPDDRQRWFGVIGAARKVGYGVGGLLAGLLVAAGGHQCYQLVVTLNAASYAVAAVLLLRMRRVSRPARSTTTGGWREVLADRTFLALSAVNIAFALATSALDIVLPVYLVYDLALPAWAAGAAFTLNTVVIALAQGSAVVLIERRSRARVLQVAGLVFATSAGVFLLADVLPIAAALAAVAAGIVLFSAAELLVSPVMGALSNEAAPQALRGRYMAVFQLSWTIANTIGLIVLTALLSFTSVAAWSFLAGAALLGSLGIGALAPHLKGPGQPSAQLPRPVQLTRTRPRGDPQ